MEDFEEDAYHSYLLDLVGLVKVVLENLFRLFASAIEQDVVEVGDVDVVLEQNFEDFVEILADEEHFGVEEPVDYRDLVDENDLVLLFGVVVLSIA